MKRRIFLGLIPLPFFLKKKPKFNFHPRQKEFFNEKGDIMFMLPPAFYRYPGTRARIVNIQEPEGY